MSIGRRLLFAGVTLLMLLGLVEAASQFVWWRLEARTFEVRKERGEAVLRNDSINFMKQADGILGYVLLPGFERGTTHINADGFAQRERVPVDRSAGQLRLAAMGESTTQGHDVDHANYPLYLRQLVVELGQNHVEMINGGVAGWISDQVALWAEHKVARYRPDIVVLYVGWNDFQSYNPFNTPAAVSYFDMAYANPFRIADNFPLKSVVLASAAYNYGYRKLRPAAAAPLSSGTDGYVSTPEVNYRFYLDSLDRIVFAFRASNPDVRIAISTLVGRWPHGSEADYTSDQGHTWWMKQHGQNAAQAAAALHRFNDLIRSSARERGLLLIDAEAAFADLDRAKLQWDFAHMTSEGYELLANVMYEALRLGGYVAGEPSPRLEELRAKYRLIGVAGEVRPGPR